MVPTTKTRFRVPSGIARTAAAIAVLAVSFGLWRTCMPFYGARTRLLLACVYMPAGAACIWAALRVIEAASSREKALRNRLASESRASRQLCVAAIESLAYAVEARTSSNLGHLSRVQSYAAAIAERLGLSEDEIDGVRAAALVHEIGRLGVPDNILTKSGELTEKEREKMRAYPVLGGRLLATIPFPWPVVPMVRHHREHFNGAGYPDGLNGEDIPLGARILAVADSYDVLVSERAYRAGLEHRAAIAQLESLAGSQFDPHVVEAFVAVVDEVNERLDNEEEGNAAASAAYEIARAQREVQTLYELACSVGNTLCLDDTVEILAKKLRTITHASTSVIYLIEQDGETLRAYAAYGTNHWHFRRSTARLGTYLTGRVAWRGEPTQASFMADDIALRHTAEPWTPLRSTLIVPLTAEGETIGTINLYQVLPDAFTADDIRVMMFVGELAGKAIKNARLFTLTQETAFTDPITGLKNARYLRHFVEQEMNRARKNHHQLAVLGMDLDRFKPVNDNYGHKRGDELLREIGRLFMQEVRNYDLVARYAGDEFAIVLPETDRERAEIVAAKIAAAMDNYADGLVRSDPQFPRIGVSIGVALFPDDAEDLQGLLAHADRGMYENKRARKAGRSAA